MRPRPEMSAVADLHLTERRAILERLRSTVDRLAGNRELLLGIASAGLLATFALMLATDSVGRIGTISFVPWVALLAAQLGPAGGSLAGVGATVLYLAAAELVEGPTTPWRLA